MAEADRIAYQQNDGQDYRNEEWYGVARQTAYHTPRVRCHLRHIDNHYEQVEVFVDRVEDIVVDFNHNGSGGNMLFVPNTGSRVVQNPAYLDREEAGIDDIDY